MSILNREEYLNKAIHVFRERLFKPKNITLPEVRASVGFPLGNRARSQLGQYFPAERSKDNRAQIFINPTADDAEIVLLALFDQCKKAAIPSGYGDLNKVDDLVTKLQKLAAFLGPYPHGSIELSKTKKSPGRLVKVSCNTCNYVARVSALWISRKGTPLCPCNHVALVVKE